MKGFRGSSKKSTCAPVRSNGARLQASKYGTNLSAFKVKVLACDLVGCSSECRLCGRRAKPMRVAAKRLFVLMHMDLRLAGRQRPRSRRTAQQHLFLQRRALPAHRAALSSGLLLRREAVPTQTLQRGQIKPLK